MVLMLTLQESLRFMEVDSMISKDELKKKYRQLAFKYHTDTTELPKPQAEELFKKLTVAYEQLKNQVPFKSAPESTTFFRQRPDSDPNKNNDAGFDMEFGCFGRTFTDPFSGGSTFDPEMMEDLLKNMFNRRFKKDSEDFFKNMEQRKKASDSFKFNPEPEPDATPTPPPPKQNRFMLQWKRAQSGNLYVNTENRRYIIFVDNRSLKYKIMLVTRDPNTDLENKEYWPQKFDSEEAAQIIVDQFESARPTRY